MEIGKINLVVYLQINVMFFRNGIYEFCIQEKIVSREGACCLAIDKGL